MIANTARQQAGNPQWHSFFKGLYESALVGLATDTLCWREDGSARHLVQVDSLLHFASNAWSQRGDDGIIRRIFQVLGVEQGFFIEFGAWDGIYLCNSRALAQRRWSGCFVEGDPGRADELRRNYQGRPDILCLNEMVRATPGPGGKTLDEIAAEHFAGRRVDFLTIDVDGLDYRIFEELELRPSVVCVEGGFSWHPRFARRVPDDVAADNLQQPLAVIIEIGRRQGYTPVCFNQNMYFVADELAEPFAGIRNDALSLWRDAWFNESQAFRDSLRRMRTMERIRIQEGPEFSQLDFDVHP